MVDQARIRVGRLCSVSHGKVKQNIITFWVQTFSYSRLIATAPQQMTFFLGHTHTANANDDRANRIYYISGNWPMRADVLFCFINNKLGKWSFNVEWIRLVRMLCLNWNIHLSTTPGRMYRASIDSRLSSNRCSLHPFTLNLTNVAIIEYKLRICYVLIAYVPGVSWQGCCCCVGCDGAIFDWPFEQGC